MIILTRDDVKLLHEIFKSDTEQINMRQLHAITGLDLRQLIEAKIVRQIGRFDDFVMMGQSFPTLEGGER